MQQASASCKEHFATEAGSGSSPQPLPTTLGPRAFNPSAKTKLLGVEGDEGQCFKIVGS